MMAYQEWIKFGRDPVYPRDFYALSKRDARTFYAKFTEAIPERMRQLEAFVRERRPSLNWQPDYTDSAFEVLIEVLHESVEKVPRTEAELEEIRGGRSEIMNVLNESIWKWSVTSGTISLAFDTAIYFGNDLINKENRMVWQLDERKVMTNHQPIVRAPNPSRELPYLDCPPVNLFRLEVFRIANNDPHVYSMVQTRRHWLENIAAYKRNNPE